MSKTEIDPYYKREARELVDFFYDKGFINPEIPRRTLEAVEDYIAFLFQSKAEASSKTALIMEQLKERKS